ncbi:hypothetical protein EJ02DRAFT_459793 [Clathrospora elynae]|uniref:HTH psq-type domain-containing protein n=1 Tax=Clathrospora elynae TaxID=706981 RepID=A0A6A5S6B7_9PLEO|nr:hypothetical protein EJ02DRAFT_459793 [Clathrospora elynae]
MTMPQQQRPRKPYCKGRLCLAVRQYQSNPRQSLRRLVAAYNVPESTLQTHLRGTPSRSKTMSVNRKLQAIGEQSCSVDPRP